MASELGPVLEALYKGERDRAGELADEAASLNVFEAAALGDAERLDALGYGGEDLERAFLDWAGTENLEERVKGIDRIDPVVLAELRKLP